MQNLAPKKLQSFQQEYALYLRDPKNTKRPSGVPARQSKIYEELLFNNICGFIDACFPVAKTLFTEKRWKLLCRQFFRDWQSHTPYFSKIPEQFVKFIQSKHTKLCVPAYLPDLLHYEWIELEVETAVENRNSAQPSKRISLNPNVRYARYLWPVHHISQTFRPRKAVPTVLLVHRDSNDKVKFLEINEMTAQLLDILAAGTKTANEAIKHLAKSLGYASPEPLLIHGHTLLADLLKQEILQGHLS